MVPHIHFEFLLQPLLLPIRKIIPHAVPIRSAPQINVSDEHPAQVADVAHAVARRSNRAEKLDRAHHNHKDAHGHRHRQRKNPHLPVRHDHRHRQQHAINRPGSPNRRDQRRAAPVRVNQSFTIISMTAAPTPQMKKYV